MGTTLEFRRRGTFEPLLDMIGGGPFRLAPGEWTDDTSMALCLAESLVERGAFDARDQLERYLRWYREGHLSVTGSCFDIGRTVEAALRTFERTGAQDAGSTDPTSAGNGSIMRLAPVVLFAFPDRERVDRLAAESSRTTHGADEAVAACRILGGVLHALIAGADRDEALASVAPANWMSPRLRDLAAGRFRGAPREAIRGTGYVVDCLEASFWCFAHEDDFEAAVLAAANLGDDADTTAAVCGQLAGACHGLRGIPERWLDRLAWRDRIEARARELFALEA